MLAKVRFCLCILAFTVALGGCMSKQEIVRTTGGEVRMGGPIQVSQGYGQYMRWSADAQYLLIPRLERPLTASNLVASVKGGGGGDVANDVFLWDRQGRRTSRVLPSKDAALMDIGWLRTPNRYFITTCRAFPDAKFWIYLGSPGSDPVSIVEQPGFPLRVVASPTDPSLLALVENPSGDVEVLRVSAKGKVQALGRPVGPVPPESVDWVQGLPMVTSEVPKGTDTETRHHQFRDGKWVPLAKIPFEVPQTLFRTEITPEGKMVDDGVPRANWTLWLVWDAGRGDGTGRAKIADRTRISEMAPDQSAVAFATDGAVWVRELTKGR